MKYIHRIDEGEMWFPGINWRSDECSRIMIGILLGELRLFFRWRGKAIMAKPRLIFDYEWRSK